MAGDAMSTDSLRLRGLLETLNHELRGPLAPLAIGIEILKRRDLDSPSAANTLAMMERQIQILKQALDEHLDESRAL
jgi:signal transduction histidine kinase